MKTEIIEHVNGTMEMVITTNRNEFINLIENRLINNLVYDLQKAAYEKFKDEFLDKIDKSFIDREIEEFIKDKIRKSFS